MLKGRRGCLVKGKLVCRLCGKEFYSDVPLRVLMKHLSVEHGCDTIADLLLTFDVVSRDS